MDFNDHSRYEGLHAFLSPSKYHWINYDDEKLDASYQRHTAAYLGTRLHALADECIQLNVKLPRNNQTLNKYVNDAIGFKMKSEVMLFYSENAFGTVDAISFRRNTLRIHDLKTGVTPTNMSQLEVYTALFCLEYKHKPEDINIELRIYQNDTVVVHVPEPSNIKYIMDKIVRYDKRIQILQMEG